MEATPQGSTARTLPRPPRREVRAQVLAGRRDEIGEAQRRARQAAADRVTHVGAVQRDARARRRGRRARATASGRSGRARRRSAVRGGAGASATAGAHVRPGREQLDLEVQPGRPGAQGIDLVADEDPERRAAGGGPHVRDDEDTHPVLILHGAAVDPSRRPVEHGSRPGEPCPRRHATHDDRCAHPRPRRAHPPVPPARADAGQGTVEYVALILLVAAVLAGVVAVGHGLKGGGIAEAVVDQLKQAISGVAAENVARARCAPYSRRGVLERPARAPDRRLRLRRRRAHRPARAARRAAARGLRLSRRHGALPVRRAHAGGARALRAGDRRRAARAAAPSCWSSPATRRRPPRCPRSRSGCARRRSASTCSASCEPEARVGRRGDAQRPHRAAGHARDGRQRRLRPRARARSTPHVELVARRLPGPRADHPGAASRSTTASSTSSAATARRCARPPSTR